MLEWLLVTALGILNWLLILRVIISWVRPRTSNETLYYAIKMIYQLTEPILEPIRKNMPDIGLNIDFSPIIAFFLISIVRRIVIVLL